MTQAEMRLIRRGNPNQSGKLCMYHDDDFICTKYGRYQVAGPETEQGEEFVSCGQHLTFYIRRIWFNSFSAAVIQEVPGMWKDKQDRIRINDRHIA